MRICLANDSFPPMMDGVVNTVVNYGTVIQKRYGEAMLAVPFYPDVRDEYPFPVVRYDSLDTKKLVGYRAGFPFDQTAMHTLQEFRPDLIHSHCPVASTFLCRELRELTGAPLIMTYHTKYDIDIKRAVKLGFLQDAAIQGLIENIESVDEVWAVNRGAGENLKHLGFSRDYVVMPNGVDMEQAAAPEEAQCRLDELYGLRRDIPLFLFVGRVMWYKGLRIILDGLKQVKERGFNFRMAFVGKGDDEKAVREYAEQLGLGQACIFTGGISDRELLRAWYSRADLFLLPSVFDNNPLVVKEAAACGTASVLVRDSSSAEGVTDNRNGLLIPEDAAGMAQALCAVCEDRLLAQRLGAAAQQELYLSWEDSIARAAKRYEEVLQAHKRGDLPPRPARFDHLIDAVVGLYIDMERARRQNNDRQKRLQDELNRTRDTFLQLCDILTRPSGQTGELRKNAAALRTTFYSLLKHRTEEERDNTDRYE